ncbi:MAG: hypothetical protein HKP58_04870 [Desulfatitalea sp.]|nr:hypothetical protein [Desulfatitalea sp.]NNJ99725.1 hypothetical protein [Desulfatitalea sp.]
MSDFHTDYFEDAPPEMDWADFEEDDYNDEDFNWEDYEEDEDDDDDEDFAEDAFEEETFDAPGIGYPSDAVDLAQIVLRFLETTPELTASEQAELIGAFVEDTMHSGEVDWARVTQGLQTGLSLFQTGAQVAGGIAGAVGGNNRTARDIALWSRRLGQGAGMARNVVGSIRPGQTPRMPTGVQRGAQPVRPYRRYSPPPPAGRQAPARTGAPGPAGAQARPPLNNTAQLASLLNNPQIMQALRSALFRDREGELYVEADDSTRMPVQIPMGDVMATIARLAQASAFELKALTGETAAKIPDYLISDDGEYIADPECTEERSALVLEYLRHQGELDRYDELDGFAGIGKEDSDEMDASEAWARDAGFDGL